MAQVILAEDEAPLRFLIAETLQDLGIDVAQAGDGIEALEVLRADSAAMLLLSDIRMPRMDGYTLVERALALSPELKVVLMTGYAQEFPPPAALKARELRTLVKPVCLDRLGELVSEMLARA